MSKFTYLDHVQVGRGRRVLDRSCSLFKFTSKFTYLDHVQVGQGRRVLDRAVYQRQRAVRVPTQVSVLGKGGRIRAEDQG